MYLYDYYRYFDSQLHINDKIGSSFQDMLSLSLNSSVVTVNVFISRTYPATVTFTVANQNQHPDLVYECCWDNCDWQFEDMQDCIEHAVAEGCGHVHMYFAAVPPHGTYNTRFNVNGG